MSSSSSPLPAPRRIVTHTKPDSNAAVWIDETLKMDSHADDTFRSGRVWVTEDLVADVQTGVDGATLKVPGIVQPTGSVITFCDLGPNTTSPMHFTHSIDYGVVTHGQTVMELTDGSRTAIDAGGIIVQLGTAHAWHNEKDEWCRILFVTLPAKGTIIDGEPLKGNHLE